MSDRSPTAAPPNRTTKVLAWAVGLAVIGYVAWTTYQFITDLRGHNAAFKGLLDHGPGFTDRWLADVRADPTAAYQATATTFRERVSAADWQTFVAAHPELRNPPAAAKLVSVGGGSVGFDLWGGRNVVPPKGVFRADPGGIEVVVVFEGEAMRVDRVRVVDATLPADP